MNSQYLDIDDLIIFHSPIFNTYFVQIYIIIKNLNVVLNY